MSRKLCWIIATIFLFNVGCERKKDRGQSSVSNFIVGSEAPATLTDDEATAVAEIVQCGLLVDELTGGNVEIPDERCSSKVPAKVLPAWLNWEFFQKLGYSKITGKAIWDLTGTGVTGILSAALLIGELMSDTERESVVDYLKRNITDQQIEELRNIKAGPDGWFNEVIGDGYVVLSRVTRIDGVYARSLEDLVKVRQNTPSAQKVIKRIEIKAISGGAVEQYTGITDPGSKTPSVLHTISYNDREVLSAGFSYNVDMKIWQGATITKKTSVGVTATCTPSSNGVDWVLEGPGWRQQWKFSYEPTGQTWSGFYAVKLWDSATGEVLLDLKNEQSGKGLLTVINLFTAGGVPGAGGALLY